MTLHRQDGAGVAGPWDSLQSQGLVPPSSTGSNNGKGQKSKANGGSRVQGRRRLEQIFREGRDKRPHGHRGAGGAVPITRDLRSAFQLFTTGLLGYGVPATRALLLKPTGVAFFSLQPNML